MPRPVHVELVGRVRGPDANLIVIALHNQRGGIDFDIRAVIRDLGVGQMIQVRTVRIPRNRVCRVCVHIGGQTPCTADDSSQQQLPHQRSPLRITRG